MYEFVFVTWWARDAVKKKLERQMIYLSSRTLMHCIPSRMHKDVY